MGAASCWRRFAPVKHDDSSFAAAAILRPSAALQRVPSSICPPRDESSSALEAPACTVVAAPSRPKQWLSTKAYKRSCPRA
eukprot:6862563-Pyramimonas_sp.AAC.1